MKKIETAIENLGDDKFEQEVAVPLGVYMTELQDLYQKKHKNEKDGTDETDVSSIRDDITDRKNKVLKLMKDIGLNPRRGRDAKSKTRN